MASEGFHEPLSKLDDSVIDRHRAIVSLMEEFEAIDWYDQRVAATDDATLAAVLAHNRDEEKEHAAMTIEWLRRHDPTLDDELRTYLFADGPITEVEEEAMDQIEDHTPDAGDTSDEDTSPGAGSSSGDETHSLRIGSLKDHAEPEPRPSRPGIL